MGTLRLGSQNWPEKNHQLVSSQGRKVTPGHLKSNCPQGVVGGEGPALSRGPQGRAGGALAWGPRPLGKGLGTLAWGPRLQVKGRRAA